MRLRALNALLVSLCLVSALRGMPPSAQPSLAGVWQLDRARSTDLAAWQSLRLSIAIAGGKVTIERRLEWGRRNYTDRMTLDTTAQETVVPVSGWPDNRNLGAYIGADQTKRVHATWLDDDRILRLSSDLELETQQGPHAINILGDYKVSADGAHLILTELRSTRDRPVVYVFDRAAP